MPRPVNFSQKSAKRIASAVRKVEGTARVPFIAQRRRGQILSSSSTTLFGKLDADLAYNSTTGVTVSIWDLNESNSWADTTEDVEGVLPGPGQTGSLASGTAVLLVKIGEKRVAFAGGGIPPGITTNDLLYWDATEEKWAILSAPATTGIFIPMVVNGILQWVAGQEFICPEPPPEPPAE